VLSLSFSCSSELFLTLSCYFVWLYHFSCCLLAFAVFHLLGDLLAFAVFHLLGDLLELFLPFFGVLAVLHGILDSNFKFFTFVVNELIKGEIKKSSSQLISLIVMSH
jgi:hypothetical protein